MDDLGRITFDEAGITELFAKGFTRVRVERSGWARCRMSAWMGDGDDVEFRLDGRLGGCSRWKYLLDRLAVPFPRSPVWAVTAEQWRDR